MSPAFLASRREALKGGVLVVSFSWLGLPAPSIAQNAQAAGKPLALNEVDTFLAIDAKGMVTVYSGKVDLGTGVQTALTQIVADELDAPLTSVTIIQGDTALTPDQGPTWGSLSIQVGGTQIRNAAAAARHALLELASTELAIRPEEMTVNDGIISGGGKNVSFGKLIGGKSFSLAVDHKAPPKNKRRQRFQTGWFSDTPPRHSGKGHGRLYLHAGFQRP